MFLNILNQGFFNGAPRANGGPRAKRDLSTLGVWPLVSFKIHRNVKGNGVYVAPEQLFLKSLWPFMAHLPGNLIENPCFEYLSLYKKNLLVFGCIIGVLITHPLA